MSIHPTAIVHSSAELAEDVEVQAFSIIDEHVRIAAGTVVGPHCVITGRTVIGKNNRFYSGAQIGILSQDLKHKPGLIGYTRIGDGNLFREFVTISASTLEDSQDEDRLTSIGDHCLFMACTHVGHDCRVGNHVIMANCSALSGHVQVCDYVTLGGLAGVHQFCRIGAQAFIGGMSRISMDVPPYMIAEGHPARCYGPNVVGLKRHGVDKDARTNIKTMYRLLYRSGLNTSQALEEIKKSVPETPERETLLSFVLSSTRGILK
ncbi:MAG TPA: acyl-ACP--UDP-N-acetylglucosamine O-acyltransferase [Candidatus Hydrogenedentes bacterium]|nr:acyl-ACP--UDP-N-acetylglucosamine O-acyltransferase [Candidatus Hydrogenedentota bacterium]